jgi:DNA-3-methyladenine glycosylase
MKERRVKNENKLDLAFYQRDDVVQIAQDLLGTSIYTKVDGIITGGMIIETESYRGPEDRASHAYNNRRTKRTEVMFHNGGICYVYLCYGMHYLLNVVTNVASIPHAVLIRAIRPTVGIDEMLRRRKKSMVTPSLTTGPGSVAQALGIDLGHNGATLSGETIWIEKGLPQKKITASPRVGVDYAGEDALLPWRFRIL